MKRTIAIQVDDPEFVAQYEQRLKESGLSLKKWLIGLMKADIANPNQTQELETPKEPNLSSLIDDPVLFAKIEERLALSGRTLSEYLSRLVQVDMITFEQTGEQISAEMAADAGSVPEQNAESLNLFVKITREQREALDTLKAETGETVGSVLNRVIEEFLGNVRDGSFPDEFDATYEYYASAAEASDTKCSAVIPAQSGHELAAYLEATGRSRNALMSSLVHMELHQQEQTMENNQGMGGYQGM